MADTTDDRNITDFYKMDRLTKWTTELIKDDLRKKSFPFSVCMENWLGDYNLACVLRSLNAFDGREMYYLGNKRYDKRGAVGTYNYTSMINLKNVEQLLELKDKYTFVALENNIDSCVPMDDFDWPDNPLIIVGEEGVGITRETLNVCDKFVYIRMWGSVRSFNASVAASIAMQDFTTKHLRKNEKR